MARPAEDPHVPEHLPLLGALSWLDRQPCELARIDMFTRVFRQASAARSQVQQICGSFIQALVARYGGVLRE